MRSITPSKLHALLLIANQIHLREDLEAHNVRASTLTSLVGQGLIEQRWHINDNKRDYFIVSESAKVWLKAVVSGLGLRDRAIQVFEVDLDHSYTVNVK